MTLTIIMLVQRVAALDPNLCERFQIAQMV